MANISLNDRAGIINLDTDLVSITNKQALFDALYRHLLKAAAISQIALSLDFECYSKTILYHYFCVLNDCIEEAALIAEHLEIY